MTDVDDEAEPVQARRRRGIIGWIFLAVVGALVIWKVGSCAKERWLDPDRMLLGVHAIDGETAIVAYRYDREDSIEWRVGRVDVNDGSMIWEHELEHPALVTKHQGMSLVGDVLATVSDTWTGSGSVVEGIDSLTGEVRWRTELGPESENFPKLAGNAALVFVSDEAQLHVLERATGRVVFHSGSDRVHHFAFDDRWLLLGGDRYLDLNSRTPVEIKGVRGDTCLVDDVAYGLTGSGQIVGQSLVDGSAVTFDAATVVAGVGKRWADSCAWRRLENGRVRLVFTTAMNDNWALAVSIDPRRAEAGAHLDWAIDLGERTPHTGHINYPTANLWDLPWFGQATRFAPLELGLRISGGDYQHQLVVVDLDRGVITREGVAFHRPVSMFRDGELIFVQRTCGHCGSDHPETDVMVVVDGATGETRGAAQTDAIAVSKASVNSGAIWLWSDSAFSRAGDLAVSVADRDVRLKYARDPDRAPVAADAIARELLGP